MLLIAKYIDIKTIQTGGGGEGGNDDLLFSQVLGPLYTYHKCFHRFTVIKYVNFDEN